MTISDNGDRLPQGRQVMRIKRGIYRSAASLALMVSASLAIPRDAGPQEVTVLLGGDIEWSGVNIRHVANRSRYLMEGATPGMPAIPRLISEERLAQWQARNDPAYLQYQKDFEAWPRLMAFYTGPGPDVKFSSTEQSVAYPLKRISTVFQKADLVFANLESPLADKAEMAGLFRTPTAFAAALKRAGVTAVSVANNHALDAGRDGLRETLSALDAASVLRVGAGRNLEDARKPVVFERHGIRIAMLAYTQIENSGFEGFVTLDRSGVMPLDPDIIKEDIARIRKSVDYVILSLHWGQFAPVAGGNKATHPRQITLAHEFVDSGADVIFGGHSHVQQAVEVYRGKPIFYSLGDVVASERTLGHQDSILAELKLGKSGIRSVSVVPIAAAGTDIFQPYPLSGARAAAVLTDMKAMADRYSTDIVIDGDRGRVMLEGRAAARPGAAP